MNKELINNSNTFSDLDLLECYKQQVGSVKLSSSGYAAKSAKEQMVVANLRLVIYVAKKYSSYEVPLLDLIQEGNIALMKAVDHFDCQRGYKFSTYAIPWIKQAMLRAIANHKTIHIPIHMNDAIKKMSKTVTKLLQKTGKTPTISELIKATGLSQAVIENIMATIKQPVAIDAPIDDDRERKLADCLIDQHIATPEQSVTQTQLKREIIKMLERLPIQEAKILRMRFGIGENSDFTLEEIGQQMEVSRERIRQLETKALARMQIISTTLSSFI